MSTKSAIVVVSEFIKFPFISLDAVLSILISKVPLNSLYLRPEATNSASVSTILLISRVY